jgi:DNA repair protein RecO (recombination protein O)
LNTSRTRAILLRKRDYSDTSLIAVFFTEDFGKLQFIIKGAKSPKKSFRSSFEHGSCYELQFRYRPGHSGLTTLRESYLIEGGSNTRKDIDRFYHLAYGIELLDAFTELEDHDHELFSISLKMLLNIDSQMDSALCLRSFETQLLQHIGLLGEINRCSGCQETFSEKCLLDYKTSRLLCPRCLASNAIVFLPEDLKGLSLLKKGELPVLTENQHFQIQKLLWFCIDFHLGKPLKSRKFVRNPGSVFQTAKIS